MIEPQPLGSNPLQLPLVRGRAKVAPPLTRGGWEGFGLGIHLAGFFLLLLLVHPAQAARLALVIGNDHYRAVTPLQNAGGDAKAIADVLKKIGFKVTLKLDVDQQAFKSALRDFKEQVSGGDEVVFYYSGHGVQISSANYLLPIDIQSEKESQVLDDAIPLQKILDNLEEQKARFSLAIIDACRDNPFKATGKRSIGGTRGLTVTSAANGQMIMFSAGTGQQALDRLGAGDRDPNGLFTRVLLREMQKPGEPVDQVLRNVREQVVQMAKSINHDQVPALYDQVVGKFYFKPGSGTQVASLVPVPTPTQPAAQAKSKEQIEDDTWSEAKGINTPDAYETYLSTYPGGRYVGQAKMKLAALKKTGAAANKPEPATKPANVAPPTSSPAAGEPVMIRIPGKNYEMGKYEVTQKEWREVMGSNPPELYFKNCGDTCPVDDVSWNDAQEFISKLNSKTGKQYRLPTEAEWEYACYGGSQTEYCGSKNVNAVAWYDANSNKTPHPVGQKQANGYGLYDMRGNVWEWTSDCYNGNCAERVLRGGSWVDGPQFARAAGRDGFEPAYRGNSHGFRLARMLP